MFPVMVSSPLENRFVLTETYFSECHVPPSSVLWVALCFHWAKFYPAPGLGTQTLTMTNGVIISHFRATLWVRRQINLIWLSLRGKRKSKGLSDNCSLKFSHSLMGLQLLLPEAPLTCCLDIGWAFLGRIQLTCQSAQTTVPLWNTLPFRCPVHSTGESQDCVTFSLQCWRAALVYRPARPMNASPQRGIPSPEQPSATSHLQSISENTEGKR